MVAAAGWKRCPLRGTLIVRPMFSVISSVAAVSVPLTTGAAAPSHYRCCSSDDNLCTAEDTESNCALSAVHMERSRRETPPPQSRSLGQGCVWN